VTVLAFIQARMTSARFPGKMLAPMAGRPVLAHVVERVAAAVGHDHVVVATSTDASDDPLAGYAEALGVKVFRGTLADVFRRFQACLQAHPCDAFFRVCGDSPLLDPGLLQEALSASRSDRYDLVTNVFPRTFPRGQSVEWLNAATFAALDAGLLTPSQSEHVTGIFYEQPERFRILNLEADASARGHESCVLDTLDDLRRMESRLLAGNWPAPMRVQKSGSPA
jgi:spore coat polysaccharide biosynthesis protein SpsF